MIFVIELIYLTGFSKYIIGDDFIILVLTNKQRIMIVKLKNIKFSLLVLGIVMFISCKSNGQSNSNERPSRDEQGGQGDRKGPPPSADEIFAQMDADENGLLEENELKGRIKNDFAKIDADQDGFISKEELEAAPKPERRGGQGGGGR